ncbi:transposase, partial [Phocaeicola vulgatus]
RMKEDHMRNGQLKPGYNPQISTNRQFILNYTIHQCAGDTSTYPLHMDNFHSLYGRYPDVSVCDAGYGSEENYLYAFRHGIETFIKYNNFHKEQKRNFRNDPFLSANFYYNEETDGMYCPMGQRMERLSDARRITDNGFVQTISRYRARNCKGCPLRCRCHRSRSERIVQVNHRLRKIKEREREKLLSDEGLKYRSQRPQDVEAVFGNLKNNKHFKRFHLRGLKKVEIEFGLLAIAHNLAKVAS